MGVRKKLAMKKRMRRFFLFSLAAFLLVLSGCGEAYKSAAEPRNSSTATPPGTAKNVCWLIEATDTKQFSYSAPSSGAINITATLYFIAWKVGGPNMLGQYKGRAMVTLDMDLSKAGSGNLICTGGVMDDSICDDISFEMTAAQAESITAQGEDVDLAPLTSFIGQADIITEEYAISQQNWQALADGEVKFDANSSFGDSRKYEQGFTLKAGEQTVLITVGDLAAAYGVEAFSGTITTSASPTDAPARFRDKVMSRMEDRLEAAEQPGMPTAETVAGMPPHGGISIDAQGREGMDTNGDGKLEIYFAEDGSVMADFDGDGNYEPAGEDGADH